MSIGIWQRCKGPVLALIGSIAIVYAALITAMYVLVCKYEIVDGICPEIGGLDNCSWGTNLFVSLNNGILMIIAGMTIFAIAALWIGRLKTWKYPVVLATIVVLLLASWAAIAALMSGFHYGPIKM